MSATSTTPVAASVPAPVEEVEKKAVADSPAPVQQVEEAAFDELNAEIVKDAAKGKDAGVSLEAADPTVTAEVKAVSSGDVPGIVSNFGSFEKEVKAGYKTTEFWLVLIGVILTQLGTLRVPGKYGDTIQTSALLGSYALSRGIAKKG